MRLKIILGFSLVALVLFFAAVTSYLELSRLTSSVQLLIDKGAESIGLSKGVLDVIQEQNLRIMSAGSNMNEDIYIQKIFPEESALMDSLFVKAAQYYPRGEEMESLTEKREAYMNVLSVKQPMTHKEYSDWMLNKYNNAFNEFNGAIKHFMLSTQNYVVKETAKFKQNIYRTTMQSLVALCVSIIVLFVFFLLIDVYFIKPVKNMTKAMDKYLNGGISFKVDFEGANEPARLKEYLTILIERDKKKREL